MITELQATKTGDYHRKKIFKAPKVLLSKKYIPFLFKKYFLKITYGFYSREALMQEVFFAKFCEIKE